MVRASGSAVSHQDVCLTTSGCPLTKLTAAGESRGPLGYNEISAIHLKCNLVERFTRIDRNSLLLIQSTEKQYLNLVCQSKLPFSSFWKPFVRIKTYFLHQTADKDQSVSRAEVDMLHDFMPGLTGIPAAKSSISNADGERVILEYLGSCVGDFCARSSFLEMSYLRLLGNCPTRHLSERRFLFRS